MVGPVGRTRRTGAREAVQLKKRRQRAGKRANTKVGEDWGNDLKRVAAGEAAAAGEWQGAREATKRAWERDMTGLGQRRAGNEGLGADDEHGYSSTAGSGRRQKRALSPRGEGQGGRRGRSSGKECS